MYKLTLSLRKKNIYSDYLDTILEWFFYMLRNVTQGFCWAPKTWGSVDVEAIKMISETWKHLGTCFFSWRIIAVFELFKKIRYLYIFRLHIKTSKLYSMVYII